MIIQQSWIVHVTSGYSRYRRIQYYCSNIFSTAVAKVLCTGTTVPALYYSTTRTAVTVLIQHCCTAQNPSTGSVVQYYTPVRTRERSDRTHRFQPVAHMPNSTPAYRYSTGIGFSNRPVAFRASKGYCSSVTNATRTGDTVTCDVPTGTCAQNAIIQLSTYNTRCTVTQLPGEYLQYCTIARYAQPALPANTTKGGMDSPLLQYEQCHTPRAWQ